MPLCRISLQSPAGAARGQVYNLNRRPIGLLLDACILESIIIYIFLCRLMILKMKQMSLFVSRTICMANSRSTQVTLSKRQGVLIAWTFFLNSNYLLLIIQLCVLKQVFFCRVMYKLVVHYVLHCSVFLYCIMKSKIWIKMPYYVTCYCTIFWFFWEYPIDDFIFQSFHLWFDTIVSAISVLRVPFISSIA